MLLCYKRPAVKFTADREFTQVPDQPAKTSGLFDTPLQTGRIPGLRDEDPSRYCPVCSQRLESRRCKLVCPVCGYYMSCADYY
ncbi:MAG: hypothetical protein DMG35_07190 [Acidobacteria bacterium]|nr:MAG: hypothetical protein DMG35_07190 [Acidobacteriota bacterium]